MANTVTVTKVYQDGSQINPSQTVDLPVADIDFQEMTITAVGGANITTNSITGLSFAKTAFHVGDRVVAAGIINGGATIASIPDDSSVVLSSSGVAANASGTISFVSTQLRYRAKNSAMPTNMVVSETRVAVLALCNAPLA